MLVTDQLRCARHGQVLLQNVSLTLSAGEVLGILGANGAGKSTLLATLAGEIPPDAGSLQWAGKPVAQFSPAMLARQRAVLPQSATLSFDLTVADIVAAGAYPFLELSPAAVAGLVTRALDLMDATAFYRRRYLQLSGGEQQRVQMARVLVQVLACRRPEEPRLLLLDEPTANLDPKHQLLLLRAMEAVARDDHIAVCMVLHDVNLAAAHCDHLLLLAQGRVAAYGTPRETLTPDVLQAVYDIRASVLPHPYAPERPLVLFDH